MASAGGGIRLPARSTRGQRIQKLLEEEDDEDDEEFWGQQAWQEDAVDDDYVSEKETSDEGDSDFSEEVRLRWLRYSLRWEGCGWHR